MKKFILFLFITFSSLCCFTQQFFPIPDLWEIDIWDGSNWNNVSIVDYEFNSDCYPIEILAQALNFETNTVENSSFTTISYNTASLPYESITQIWDSDTNTWVNNIKINTTYDGNENVTEVLYSSWVSGDWELNNRTRLFYNSSSLVNESIEEDWVSDVWKKTYRTTTTYNTNDAIDIETDFNWNSTSMSWENEELRTYDYIGAQNLLNLIDIETWNGTGWESDALEEYSYDTNDYVIGILESTWNGASYENDTRQIITNNSEGYPTETITQSWVIVSWINTSRDTRTYNECANLAIDEYEEIKIEISPNPSSDWVSIKLESGLNGLAKIMDTNGRILTTYKIDKFNNKIPISTFSEGIYYIVINSNERQLVKKIIIKR
ncbi:T9SS type A sorting domain-containing protein [Urechidicola croceus]|uniref:Secretion system C-terminal sorting domain-containing protein n=1 Tax=Urechidicola croceus TaxID=1850246 RepID=A0A1D8P9S1_9FLAO|nr:T9SS type A sorting domain-containing protein [Urechidicola croceus]AOW21318.1 hypothetical protein LPB138_11790 [Urechidicola croceus]